MEAKNAKKKWITGLSSIRNSLSVEGTVEAVNSSAITGMEGLFVKKVDVTRGDQIRTDTVLYEVDMEDLQSRLGILQAEEEVWQVQVQAEKSEAATGITRAQEDYNAAVA